MNTHTLPARVLDASARFWFSVAAIGLGIFATYILLFYGTASLRGDPAAWNKVLSKGYIAGDALGNAVLASHLLLAVIVTLGGVVQLIPAIRRRVPALHRWNGRLFLLAAVAAGLGGTWMMWTRGAAGDTTQHVATTVNAAAIALCAVMTWRHALARRLDAHRRWALRLFLVANGVWFFRVILMLWLLVWRKPVGFDPQSFTGPFLTTLAYTQLLGPLLVLQLYLVAKERGGPALRWAVAGGVGVLALATGLGIFGATMGMWLPRM